MAGCDFQCQLGSELRLLQEKMKKNQGTYEEGLENLTRTVADFNSNNGTASLFKQNGGNGMMIFVCWMVCWPRW